MTKQFRVGDIVRYNSDDNLSIDNLSKGTIGVILQGCYKFQNQLNDDEEIEAYIKWKNPNIDFEWFTYEVGYLDIIGREKYPEFKVGDIVTIDPVTSFGNYNDIDDYIEENYSDFFKDDIKELKGKIIRIDDIECDPHCQHGIISELTIKWNHLNEETTEYYNPYMLKILNEKSTTKRLGYSYNPNATVTNDYLPGGRYYKVYNY